MKITILLLNDVVLVVHFKQKNTSVSNSLLAHLQFTSAKVTFQTHRLLSSKMTSSSPMSSKRKLDVLFTIHSVVAALTGALAFILPNVFEHFMIIHEYEGADSAHPGGETKITHLVIRIYGRAPCRPETQAKRSSNHAGYLQAL
jgi:hypothetical protein